MCSSFFTAADDTRTMWNGRSGSILAPLVEWQEWQHPSPLVEWQEWQHAAATPAIPQKHHCEERSDEESEIRQHISRTVTASKGHHLY